VKNDKQFDIFTVAENMRKQNHTPKDTSEVSKSGFTCRSLQRLLRLSLSHTFYEEALYRLKFYQPKFWSTILKSTSKVARSLYEAQPGLPDGIFSNQKYKLG
jgi:hypothetical protein